MQRAVSAVRHDRVVAKTRKRRPSAARARVLRRRRIVAGVTAATLVALIVAALVPLITLTRAWNAAWNAETRREAVDLTAFDAGSLISDDDFYDGDALTADQIQAFLDDQVGACTSDTCLANLQVDLPARAPIVSDATGRTICEGWDGGRLTAAEVIDRVQRACGISAKVILVTLQKEQSLVAGRTARAPSPAQLGAAMGARCPDDAACDAGVAGFAEQVAQGVTDLKSYSASDFMRQPGTHYIAYSPDPACGGSDVTIANEATAALYNYTPYQPNPAALAARWGAGDACSAYGNRNFALYWALWFG